MLTFSLDGCWQTRKRGTNDPFNAMVPGDIHNDLLNAGRIPDPFYRDNETKLFWIGESDWIYEREFTVPAEALAHEKVMLRCEGLDTFATVKVNGKEIGKTDNMFRTWELDAKSALKSGKNHIEILLTSVLPYIRQRQEKRPIACWGTQDGPGNHKYAVHSWVRKEQCNFGWDWGLKAVTCGIWRGISLVACSGGRLDNVRIDQQHSGKGKPVGLDINIQANRYSSKKLTARSTISFNGKTVAEGEAELSGKDIAEGVLKLKVSKPELWWPNNMGAQNLYTATVELLDKDGSVLDTWSKRIGLRTLELDCHDDKWGQSFQYKVNGIPFFAKGANWIPVDGILARRSEKLYRKLLTDTATANMNCIRVWGGGIYEEDYFYDLCDELGICVWQDFMFACAAYPVFDKDFMKNVEVEVRQNVIRLRHHASLAMWCGNNELEQGLVSDVSNEKTMSWEEYGQLFEQLIKGIVNELYPQGSYWPGSPHSPQGDRKDFNNPACGDAHLWSVWHGGQPFEWYRTCQHRFNSEFGFQSFPEPKTLYPVIGEGDRNITTRAMEHRQRSGIGNTTIMRYMLEWFRLPDSFEMTIWLSQILQGMAIKYAVEHWRRQMPRGMGTVYWQLNDYWQAPSWSSIDYHCRWKALHYMARNFFAPVLCSVLEDTKTGKMELHLTSDHQEKITGKLTWTVTDALGTELLSGSKNASTPVNGNACVHELDLSQLLTAHESYDLLVWLRFDYGDGQCSENLALFSRPKHIELAEDAGIELDISKACEGVFDVTVTCDHPALWCWLELEDMDADFSDNFFHIRPGVEKKIIIKPQVNITGDELSRRISLRSLVDTF